MELNRTEIVELQKSWEQRLAESKKLLQANKQEYTNYMYGIICPLLII